MTDNPEHPDDPPEPTDEPVEDPKTDTVEEPEE